MLHACVELFFNIIAYDNNIRTVVLPDGKKREYLYVSMTPSNWYQWFDPQQPGDSEWTTVCI